MSCVSGSGLPVLVAVGSHPRHASGVRGRRNMGSAATGRCFPGYYPANLGGADVCCDNQWECW